MQTTREIRYAFERDMVRRLGAKAFRKHDIMRLCAQCGTDITGSHAARKFCKECSGQRRRDQTRKHVAAHRERKTEEVYMFTMVDRHNLVTALIRACVLDVLKHYQGMKKFNRASPWAEAWLLDCAEPYMAAVGEHINIDQILEKIDAQSV